MRKDIPILLVTILLLNVPIDQVSDQGWLLGPFPEGGLWQPFSPAALFDVQWFAIFEQAVNIAAILIVSTIALLLNASGLELTVKRDIDEI